MRILVHDYGRHAFPGELSRGLARSGHEVLHVFAGYNNTPLGDLEKKPDDPEKFDVEGIYTNQPLQKYSYVKRWLQELEYGDRLSEKVKAYRPDVVISSTTPLDAQKKLFYTCKKKGIQFIFWLQDLNGVAAYRVLRKKIPILGATIGRYHIHLERNLLRKSNQIVSISEDFSLMLHAWGVNRQKIHVIPNWAVVEKLPVRPKENPWSLKLGLADKFCFLYSGSIGLKHNPGLLLQLANHYRDQTQVRVVVISEGLGAEWLKTRTQELGLQNLLLMGYQPFDCMPNVLGAADVLIAVLEPDAGVFSIPSKVLTYFCANRPLLASIPGENLAARILKENRAGCVVSPDQPDAWIQAADKLLMNPELRIELGKNGRAYAENNFQIGKIVKTFEALIQKPFSQSSPQQLS